MLLSVALVQELNCGYAEGGFRLSPGVANALAQLRKLRAVGQRRHEVGAENGMF